VGGASSDTPVSFDMPNPIVNGNLDVWQRGTSFAAIADGKYSADRWRWVNSGAAVHTVTRSTDFPTFAQSGAVSAFSFKAACTTLNASPGLTDLTYFGQWLEGYVYRAFAFQQHTFGFWVKTNKTGSFSFFETASTPNSYVTTFTVNAANTWEYKTITVPARSYQAADVNDWLFGGAFGFVQCAGSSQSQTGGAWAAATKYNATGATNNCSAAGDYMMVSQVNVALGPSIPVLLAPAYADELARCYRYAFAMTSQPIGAAVGPGNLYNQGAVIFPVTMRLTPTIGALPAAAYTASGGAAGTPSLLNACPTGTGFNNPGTGWTTGAQILFSGILEAEL